MKKTLLLGLLRNRLRLLVLLAISYLMFWLLYIFLLLRPSNTRTWESGMEHPPRITIAGTSVFVHNVRDFRHTPEGTLSYSYLTRAFDIDAIQRVWFVEEPFIIPPFTAFTGVAHTYFVFDFHDQEPVVISVEARREKGETYSAWRGLFNNYELIYVWATEEDVTVRRAVLENNELYMYPLTISLEAAKQLFLELAQTSHELETNPRFYNTLTSNCTNELAKAANKVRPGAIPRNVALLFPGYSEELLYRLGFIPNDVALEALRKRYYISALVKELYDREGFSILLRLELERSLVDNAAISPEERFAAVVQAFVGQPGITPPSQEAGSEQIRLKRPEDSQQDLRDARQGQAGRQTSSSAGGCAHRVRARRTLRPRARTSHEGVANGRADLLEGVAPAVERGDGVRGLDRLRVPGSRSALIMEYRPRSSRFC
jgi:hypothetical protein